MARGAHIALMAMVYLAGAGAGLAQTDQSWELDEAAVKSIEATLTLPSRDHWKPGPLDSYARYYTIMVLNGRKVIYGNLRRGRMATEMPGVYLRRPPRGTGGGCDQIQLWYDIEAQHMIRIQCYGLG